VRTLLTNENYTTRPRAGRPDNGAAG